MKQKTIFYIFFLIFTNVNLFSQSYILTESSKVSILTCGSGNQLYSIFGHTAIRIKDNSLNLDVVYNYGTFDFNTPNFYLKFIKGDLQYFVSNTSFQTFLHEYQYDNRDMFEQVLNLNLYQKQQLLDVINNSLYSNERYYNYKFIDKNCTTMVRDKVVNVLENVSIIKIESSDKEDYRSTINAFLDNLFFEKLGINILFGYKTDLPAYKLFLPEELMVSLENLNIKEENFVLETNTLNSQDKKLLIANWWNSVYVLIAFLVLIAVVNNKRITYSYLTISGILGLFLLCVGFYSNHNEVLFNYNALLFNPLLIALVFLQFIKNKKLLNLFYNINLAFIGAYLIILLNKSQLFTVLPFILLNTYLLIKLKRENKYLPCSFS